MIKIRSVIYILTLCVAAGLLMPAALDAKLGKAFTALEDTYNRGNMDALTAQMVSVKPTNDDERALIEYYNAMKEARGSQELMLNQIINKYPKTLYGYKSRLELAKIHILEREYAKAKDQLQKITSPEIMERYYWLAVCADALDEQDSAIANAENYLRNDPAGSYREECTFLICESYISRNQFQSALSTLNKLQNPQDQQYYEYLAGYCHQMLKNPTEAVKHYKAAIEVDPNGQFAYTAEDRLFELKQSYGSKVDLSFLFPYPALDIPLELVQEPPSIVIPVVRNPIPDTPLKLNAKPTQGKYIQAGCFKVEANASSHAYSIRKLNLPAHYYYDKKKDWVVISGPYEKDAEQALSEMKAAGIDCFIVNMK